MRHQKTMTPYNYLNTLRGDIEKSCVGVKLDLTSIAIYNLSIAVS